MWFVHSFPFFALTLPPLHSLLSFPFYLLPLFLLSSSFPPSLLPSLPPSLPSSFLPLPRSLLPLFFTSSWYCRVMYATSKHSTFVKRPHMPMRHTRVTCYDFLTQGRESYSGELVNASEWNTGLVVRVTCEFVFVFFLNLVPSLNDEKRIEVSIL